MVEPLGGGFLRGQTLEVFIFMYSQTDIRRLFRGFCLREFLLEQNTSGVYVKQGLSLCARKYNINYNTLRMELKTYQRLKILVINKGKIKLNKLNGSLLRLWKAFQAGQTPEETFNLLIYRNLRQLIYWQGLNESKKIQDPRFRRKYLRTVTDTKTSVGALQNIFIACRNFATKIERSPSTAARYLRRIEKAGYVGIKRNFTKVGELKDIEFLKRQLGGRIFTEGNEVFMRDFSTYYF